MIDPTKPRFRDIPQFIQSAGYRVDVSWDFLEKWIEENRSYDNMAKLDLEPDFQRAHVWNKAQQTAYVEYILRGGVSSRELYFNCKGWMGSYEGPFVIVDGKQRLEAVRAFMRGEVKAFGYLKSEYADRPNLLVAHFSMNINSLKTRKEVLQWYLDLNTGGTVHTNEEIERVKCLLEKE